MNSNITTALVIDPGQPEPHRVGVLAVDFGPQSLPLSAIDQEREWLIQVEGLMLQVEMSVWNRTGNFDAHAAATRHCARQSELIKGRSPAVVARMEAERGLTHA